MKKPIRTYVIEQDEHLQNLRKIIKRDYFGTSTAQEEKQSIKLTLNDYLINYKSNENQLFSEMVQNDKDQWKKNHWWIDKQDKMLMIANSEKYQALPYHNMIEHNPNINGINTSVVKQDSKNSFFFNRQKNFGSLQPNQYDQSKKVIYSNCKLNDPISRMRQQISMKIEEITPRRDQRYQNSKSRKNDNKQIVIGDTPLDQDQEDQVFENSYYENRQFHIQKTPEREILLSNLNNKINKEKLQNSKKSEHVMKILGSITPGISSRLQSKHRYDSSVRRANDSVKRNQKQAEQKSDISGLLNIKK